MKENKINNKIKVLLSNQKGMALITTLIFVFVLVTLAVALLTMTSNDTKLSALQRESTRAFYLAETGIEKALWYINFSPYNADGLDWRTTEAEPYSDYVGPSEEDFSVVVTTVEEDDGEATKIKFISTGVVNKNGQYNKGKRKIEVILEKGVAQNNSLSYNFAILAKSDITIKGNLKVNGDIHSNGDLTVTSDIAFTSTPETATVSASGIITGYPDGIKAEPQLVPRVDFDYYRGIADTHINEDMSPDYIQHYDVKGEINLTGITVIEGDVIIQPPCTKVTITNGAILATGNITISANVEVVIIHDEGYTNPLSIISDLGDINIYGNVHGEGIIQSNEGEVWLHGDVNIEKGAICAKNGLFSGGGGVANVVYDDSYQGLIVEGTGVEVWKKASWREVY